MGPPLVNPAPARIAPPRLNGVLPRCTPPCQKCQKAKSPLHELASRHPGPWSERHVYHPWSLRDRVLRGQGPAHSDVA